MPETVTRLDRWTLDAVRRTDNGYLQATGIATRTGVLTYSNADGSTRRELRHPDEVFRPDSLDTLRHVPVTHLHPPVLLDAANTREYARGTTGDDARRDGHRVAVGVTITDADLIASVDAGKVRELSCGYRCDLMEEAGTYQGEAYTHRQTNIRYNHLAVVPRGRAGPEVRLRLDAAETAEEMPPMAKITIDGVDYEASEAVAAAVTGKVRTDAATIAAQTERADKAEARADASDARADAAAEEMKKHTDAAPPDIRGAVKARLSLETVARKALAADQVTKLDEMDDSAVKLAVIKAHRPTFDATGRSDAYLDAAYDAAAEAIATRTDSTGDMHKAAADAQRQDGEPDSGKARSTFAAANKDAWKQPIGVSTNGGK